MFKPKYERKSGWEDMKQEMKDSMRVGVPESVPLKNLNEEHFEND